MRSEIYFKYHWIKKEPYRFLDSMDIMYYDGEFSEENLLVNIPFYEKERYIREELSDDLRLSDFLHDFNDKAFFEDETRKKIDTKFSFDFYLDEKINGRFFTGLKGVIRDNDEEYDLTFIDCSRFKPKSFKDLENLKIRDVFKILQ